MPCPICEAPLLGNPDICPECGHRIRALQNSALQQRQAQTQAQARAQAQAQARARTQAQTQAQARTQAQAQGQVEAMPGLIDSRLFGAYVPENLATETMPGLETTAVNDSIIEEAPAQSMPGLELSSYASDDSARPTQVETIPGLIDSRLFGAYVPEGVDAPVIEGFEQDRFDAESKIPRKKSKKASKNDNNDWVGVCPACGTKLHSARCPDCGNPAQPFDEDT